MDLIDSGKRALVTVVVKVPPGMKDHEVFVWIANNFHHSAAFYQMIENTNVQLGKIQPAAPPGGIVGG